MTKNKPTKTQQEVIERLRQDGGTLFRLDGGFWTTRSTKMNARNAPEWFVGVQTVRAMEANGLLVRCWRDTAEWRDERRLAGGVQ